MYIRISKSKIEGKKLTAIFYNDGKVPIKTMHFGVVGYPHYTIPPHDKARRNRYITRYRSNESRNDPMTVGALSRYVLWEYISLSTASNQYANKVKVTNISYQSISSIACRCRVVI